ncbi:MAG: hypothetical protein H0W61_17630, partial [Bacteroidetes bacterium]|nr:hypothetical protein [Bacteroidota bacterium]
MLSARRYIYSIFLFFAWAGSSWSQVNDSLLNAINLKADDTTKVNELNAYTRELIITADFISAIPVANKALQLGEKLN